MLSSDSKYTESMVDVDSKQWPDVQHDIAGEVHVMYRVSQKNFNCLIRCKLKTTVFTRSVFTFLNRYTST